MFISNRVKNAALEERMRSDYGYVASFGQEMQQAIKEMAQDSAKQVTEGMRVLSFGAVERVAELVQSNNEEVATRNAHFVINHTIGMPTQKSESKNLNINIDILAD